MLAMYTSKHRLQAQLWFSLHYLVDEGCLPTYDIWKSQLLLHILSMLKKTTKQTL